MVLERPVIRLREAGSNLDILFILEKFPGLAPIINEFSQIPAEFNHGLMVFLGSERVFFHLFSKGIINKAEFDYYRFLSMGAILHDIGKLGVMPSSIESSLNIMNANFTGKKMEIEIKELMNNVLSKIFIH